MKSEQLEPKPTWRAAMPAIIAVFQTGNVEARAAAAAQLMRMAEETDLLKEGSATSPTPLHTAMNCIELRQIWKAIGSCETVALFEGAARDVAAYRAEGALDAAHALEIGHKMTETEALAQGLNWAITLTYRR